MSIADNLKQVLAELPQGVRLVAVSKFHPNEAIEEAYQAGQRIFGESKVQEMTAKYESLPKDIEWHFIGHLQSNKIKYMIPYVAMIHGIDTYKLLAEVNKQAGKAGRTVNCLLQIHVAQEETKFGFSPEECREMLDAGEWKALAHVRICGLMGMASNTDNIEQINGEFRLLSSLFKEIKENWFADSDVFRELSMGMSHDYHGIDTYKLLAEVNKQAGKAGRTVNCLLQIHVAQEETKFGFSPEECREMLDAGEWKALAHVRICGLMGMASNTDNIEQINGEFRLLSSLFKEIKENWFADSDVFRELSMGMSHDYHEAIASGSTLVRVGSKIFGEREYNI